MQRIKKNWVYVLVGLVAIVLVTVTILLQIAILSNQQAQSEDTTAQDSSVSPGPIQGTTEPLGLTEDIAGPNDGEIEDERGVGVEAQEDAALRGDDTDKSEIGQSDVVLEGVDQVGGIGGRADKTALPLATRTPSTQQIETTRQPTEAPPTLALPTATVVVIETPTPVPDLRIGTITRNESCQFFTEISEQLLEQSFDIEIEQVYFENAADLFASLATTGLQRQSDLTLCFTDPEDRIYISQYFGYIKLLGRAYWQNDTQKLQIMANSSILTPLEQERPCVYTYFQKLHFENIQFESLNTTAWIIENSDIVQTWTTCQS